jgi:hypothetical protein
MRLHVKSKTVRIIFKYLAKVRIATLALRLWIGNNHFNTRQKLKNCTRKKLNDALLRLERILSRVTEYRGQITHRATANNVRRLHVARVQYLGMLSG